MKCKDSNVDQSLDSLSNPIVKELLPSALNAECSLGFHSMHNVSWQDQGGERKS